jgi:hypothetical protein
MDAIERGASIRFREPRIVYFGFTDMCGGSIDDATLGVAHRDKVGEFPSTVFSTRAAVAVRNSTKRYRRCSTAGAWSCSTLRSLSLSYWAWFGGAAKSITKRGTMMTGPMQRLALSIWRIGTRFTIRQPYRLASVWWSGPSDLCWDLAIQNLSDRATTLRCRLALGIPA